MADLYNTGNYSYPQLSSEYGVAKSTILGWVKYLSKVTISDTETISVKDYKALLVIFEYIESWYNRKRIYSALGYKTPQQV